MRDGPIGHERVLLVEETYSDFVRKGPPEEVVVLRPHEHQKDGEVRPLAQAVSIEVCSEAHAVAVETGVEGRAVEGHRLAGAGLALPPTDLVDLEEGKRKKNDITWHWPGQTQTVVTTSGYHTAYYCKRVCNHHTGTSWYRGLLL